MVVRELVQAWLGVSRMDEKLKLTGEQLIYENDAVYVYAYAESDASGKNQGSCRVKIHDASELRVVLG